MRQKLGARFGVLQHGKHEGSWGEVRWACNPNGRSLAKEFFDALDAHDAKKADELLSAVAERGTYTGEDKIRKVHFGSNYFWELRMFQVRFLGDFTEPGVFVIFGALRKKDDKLSKDALYAAHALRAGASNGVGIAFGRPHPVLKQLGDYEAPSTAIATPVVPVSTKEGPVEDAIL